MADEIVRVYNSLKWQLIQIEGSREVEEKLQPTIPTVSIHYIVTYFISKVHLQAMKY